MFQLNLLGPPELLDAMGAPIQSLSGKALQLLAYLWYRRGRPQPRAHLAGILWPDSEEKKGRHSLSQTLSQLRKALPGSTDPPLLLISKEAVQFNSEAECSVDVSQFEKHLEQGQTDLNALSQAITLHRDLFVKGCYEDWCEAERGRLHERLLQALARLAQLSLEEQQYETAIEALKRLLVERPWEESAHRRLMEVYYLTGFRTLALNQYKTCSQNLQEELAVSPDEETEALYRKILAHRAPPAPEPVRQPQVFVQQGQAGRVSIAVLPFADLSPKGDHAYFADGLCEELIHALTKLRTLRVISHASSFAFKGQPILLPQLGGQLNVDSVVEGSVRTAGKRLRITAQLSSVNQDTTLWSETFDRQLGDVFAIQEEITEAIVTTLKVQLREVAASPLFDRLTDNLDAHGLYLKGRHCWNLRSEASLNEAIQYFEQSLAQDPRYAQAHAGLADAYNVVGYYGFRPKREVFQKAKRAALKAIELDNQLAEAHISLALVQDYQWEWEAAERAYQRALTLNDGFSTVHHWYAMFLMNMGRFDEASGHMERALDLDPLSVHIHRDWSHVLYHARRFEEAEAQLQKTLDLAADFPLVQCYRGLVALQQGRLKEAKACFDAERRKYLEPLCEPLWYCTRILIGLEDKAECWEQFHRLGSQEHVSPYWLAVAHVMLEDADLAFDWLERAYETSDFWLSRLKVDPLLDPLRADPRFDALLAKMDLQ